MARSRLHELSAHGVSVWVDSLSREMLETGHLARLIDEDAVVGVTSNPTIFEKALSDGGLVRRAAPGGARSLGRHEGGLLRTRREDIKRACDLLRPSGSERRGRRVRLDRGRSGSCVRARRDVRAGEAAARARRPAERLREDPGHGLRGSVRSRTRSRQDARSTSLSSSRSTGTLASRRHTCAASSGWSRTGAIRRMSSPSRASSSHASTPKPTAGWRRSGAKDLQGRLAVDNAKLAYQHYLEIFSGERWDALAAAGARPQRCLWASTSTKNPAYRDVLYVEELIGADTVNTMPFETIAAFQDHGVVRDTLTEGMDEARCAACGTRRGRDRLRGRDRDARGRGRPEVRGLLRVAAPRHRREAGCSRLTRSVTNICKLHILAACTVADDSALETAPRKSGEWAVRARVERFGELALLVLLANGPTHGYELIERLPELSGEDRVDVGNLYRTLRSLEDEGLVSSEWSADLPGPTKRTYTLTDEGHACSRRGSGRRATPRRPQRVSRDPQKGGDHVRKDTTDVDGSGVLRIVRSF